MRKSLLFVCVIALVFGTGNVVSAWEITADDLTAGALSVDLGFATATASPRAFQHREYSGVSGTFEGVGIKDGSVPGEINSDESILFDITESIQIAQISLGFLFEAGNHSDVTNEFAVIDYWDMQNNLYSGILSVQDGVGPNNGKVALWSGLGSVENVFPALQGEGGLWQLLNPFGDMLVKSVKFRANNLSGNTGSDFVFVSMTASNVPEPSTVLLLGFGVLGMVAFGRKYTNK